MVANNPVNSGWTCKGADPPNIPNPAITTATVVLAKAKSSDPSVQLACTVITAQSTVGRYPIAEVFIDPNDISKGYVLTSGGCSSTYSGHGSSHAEPIVESVPTENMQGWHCAGADPANTPNDASVTAYAVACRLFGKNRTDISLRSHLIVGDPVGPMLYPASHAATDSNNIVGGGCAVSYATAGSNHAEHMVVNTSDDGKEWLCKGADPPNISNPASARSYGIAVSVEQK
jgi:hypothetical protein